jgi:hypothetical protein
MSLRRKHRATSAARYVALAAAIAVGGTIMLAGCGGSTKPAAASVQVCGTSKTAANVPVYVEIRHGTVTCSVAMTIEKSYAQAIVEGHAPGNGGGGPVPVQGWTCQGFSTPVLLKTGDASKCDKDGEEILEILKTT